jgi:hypothetical protein
MTVTADGSACLQWFDGYNGWQWIAFAVIGHEIGHANHDSRDAIKAAFIKGSACGRLHNQIKWRPLQTVN